jgi:thiosulfate dehydrogenase [quinone] large subunit
MVMNFLRGNKYAAMVLTLVRLYLGWKWMEAGWHKITGEQAFDATGFLNKSIENPIMDNATGEAVYPNLVGFLENFALPTQVWRHKFPVAYIARI